MSPTALRKKNQVLLVKVETTYDTDPTPTGAANSILAIDPQIKEIIDPVRRPAQIASLSRIASVDGKKFSEVTFKVELKGSGTAGTAPRIGALLRACGFGETLVAVTSATYLPVSTSQESCTIYVYIDGRRHIVTGCVGDVKQVYEAGQLPMLEFTMRGRWAASALASLPSVTLETTLPVICKSLAFSYNSKSTLVTKTITVEMNNVIAERPSLNDANSIAGFLITGRDPMVTIDPEMIIETSYAFRTDAFTNQRALAWVIGTAAGNIATFSIPKWNPYFPEYSDRDEIMVETIKGEAVQNSGNDEVSLIFT